MKFLAHSIFLLLVSTFIGAHAATTNLPPITEDIIEMVLRQINSPLEVTLSGFAGLPPDQLAHVNQFLQTFQDALNKNSRQDTRLKVEYNETWTVIVEDYKSYLVKFENESGLIQYCFIDDSGLFGIEGKLDGNEYFTWGLVLGKNKLDSSLSELDPLDSILGHKKVQVAAYSFDTMQEGLGRKLFETLSLAGYGVKHCELDVTREPKENGIKISSRDKEVNINIVASDDVLAIYDDSLKVNAYYFS